MIKTSDLNPDNELPNLCQSVDLNFTLPEQTVSDLLFLGIKLCFIPIAVLADLMQLTREPYQYAVLLHCSFCLLTSARWAYNFFVIDFCSISALSRSSAYIILSRLFSVSKSLGQAIALERKFDQIHEVFQTKARDLQHRNQHILNQKTKDITSSIPCMLPKLNASPRTWLARPMNSLSKSASPLRSKRTS